MERIHWHPTLIGDTWVFDLTHRATSTKVPERTFAAVAIIRDDGKIVCSTYQAMTFETRLVDRFDRPAEDRGRPPGIAGNERDLCEMGWTHRGRLSNGDYVVEVEGHGPRRLYETFGGRADAVVEVWSCPRRPRDFHESIQQLEQKVRGRAADRRDRRQAPHG